MKYLSMAVFDNLSCMQCAAVTICVTSAWVYFARKKAFPTLALAMFVPTVFALLYATITGEILSFLGSTLGIVSRPVPDNVSSWHVQYFSIPTACLVSLIITIVTLAFCILLNLSLGWGSIATGRDKQSGNEEQHKVSMREMLRGFIYASGEEIGWRCYLLPCLVEIYGPSHALFISGIGWGLCHVAVMILLTARFKVHRPVTTVIVQCMAVFLVAFPHGWISIRSGYSLWPSAVMHFSWNFLNPRVLGSIYTQEPGWITGTQWLINGEGLAGCIVTIPLVLLTLMDLAG